jgi:hypothetical protein
MASTARKDFLDGLHACRTATDHGLVRASDATGAFLRRGLTVSAFNLLETFLSDRIEELSAHINGGRTQFSDLPESLQKRAIANTLEVSVSRARRLSSDVSTLRSFSKRLGQSLAAVDQGLDLSPLTWMWSGSNMAANDYASVLRSFHIFEPWKSSLDLAGRLAFQILDYSGNPIDVQNEMTNLARERHRCAHTASYNVTTIWIRVLPDQILRFAVVFDILASVGASLLRNGDPAFLANEQYVTATMVGLRFIRERSGDFAEFTETGVRATSRNSDPSTLFTRAARRCGSTDAVVQQDLSKAIVNWEIPAVG